MIPIFFIAASVASFYCYCLLSQTLQGALFAPLHPPNLFLCLCKERGKETHIGELKFPYAPLRNGIASRCLDEEKVTNLADTVAKNPGAKVQGSGDLCDSLISIRVLPAYTNRAAICVPERFLRGL